MQPLSPECLYELLIRLGLAITGFALVLSPLLIWLNLRRLRLDLRADLTALRESLDRLSGTTAPGAATVDQEEVAEAASRAVAPAEAEKIGFSCPGCGKFFEGPATLGGTTYTCTDCGIDFLIHEP